MLKICNFNLSTDDTGATGIEYALIASLLAVALASTISALGNGVNSHYETIADEVAEVN